MMHWLTIYCFGFVALSRVHSLNNGVARTPPMGWLAWERFRCNTNCTKDPTNCISEKLFMQMADHMAADGYRDKGYEYVNIDDCWADTQRDSQGNLQSDPDRFPHGIKYLADYVHNKGLKLGIYSDYGNKTCSGFPGSGDHMQQDMQTFADWGVDMLKMDGCNAGIDDMPMGYAKVAQLLNSTGRPIVFSCSWPAYFMYAKKTINYGIAAESCNLWRNYNDIDDNWKNVGEIINFYTKNQLQFQPYAGPGNWNDPDQIIVGDGGLNIEQQKAQMGIWSIFAAPLLMSNDLRNIPQESVEILQNSEVIAVNQDPLGIQGSLVDVINNTMILSRPLVDSELAVVFFHNNEDDGPVMLTIDAVRLGIATSNIITVRDLFAEKAISTSNNAFTITVPAVGIVMVKITVS